MAEEKELMQFELIDGKAYVSIESLCSFLGFSSKRKTLTKAQVEVFMRLKYTMEEYGLRAQYEVPKQRRIVELQENIRILSQNGALNRDRIQELQEELELLTDTKDKF